MSKIAIMTDSNSGVTQAEAKELGVTVVPMPFFVDGKEYLEDVNLTSEQFFEWLNQDKTVSTSQPGIGVVTTLWDELLEKNDYVIYMPMSSGLSKSCETATMAAKDEEYAGKVFVVDNQRISVPLKQAIFDALEMIKRGYDVNKIVDVLMETKLESDIYIMLNTLTNLKKGGRITPAAAALGGFLKLKPVLLIKGEKLDSYRMRNRTLENGKAIMIEACKKNVEGYMKEKDGRTDNVHFEIAYTGSAIEYVEDFKQEIAKEFGIDPNTIIANQLGLSIACHTGDGALGMAVTKYIPD